MEVTQQDDAVTLPRFEVCPIMATTLPAVLAMHWKIKESAVQSQVEFRVGRVLPDGGVVPLNQVAQQLLTELGLLSFIVERRKERRT